MREKSIKRFTKEKIRTALLMAYLAAVLLLTAFTVSLSAMADDAPLVPVELAFEDTDDGGARVTGIAENPAVYNAAGAMLRIVIPEKHDGKPVTEISAGAFDFFDEGFTNVHIAQADFSGAVNLEKIGNYAFWYSRLTELDLTSCIKLESIGMSAFFKSEYLRTLLMSGLSELKSINAYAFNNCVSLGELNSTGLDSLQSIGANAFSYCGFTRLTLSGAGAVEFGYGAFSSCDNLAVADLSGLTVKSYAGEVFDGCVKLTAVYLGVPAYGADGKAALTMSSNSFKKCESLRDLIAPVYAGGDEDYDSYFFEYNKLFGTLTAIESEYYRRLLTYPVDVSFIYENETLITLPCLSNRAYCYRPDPECDGVWKYDIDFDAPAPPVESGTAFVWRRGWSSASIYDRPAGYSAINIEVYEEMNKLDVETYFPADKKFYTSDTLDGLISYIASSQLAYAPSSTGADYVLGVYVTDDGGLSYLAPYYSLSLPEGVNGFRAGENEVIVSFNGLTGSFVLTVEAVELVSYEAQPFSAGRDYKAFEKFDASGLIVIGHYNNGTERVPDYTVIYPDGRDSLRCGDEAVYIDFGGGIEPLRVPVKVVKADYDMSGVTFSDAEYKYDGKAKSLKASGALPDGVSVYYDVSNLTEPGKYLITAAFMVADTHNYNPIPSMTAALTITQKPFSVWTVAGIVLGGIALSAAAVFIAVYVIRSRKRGLAVANMAAANPPPLSGDEVAAVRQIIVNGQKPPSPVIPALPEGLTLREREVAVLLLAGKKAKDIAAKLFISIDTVKNHISGILRKSGCPNQLAFVLKYGGSAGAT